jgi:hypothetical protein
MAGASAVAPLADGRGVLVSAWRDVHEGARADLLSLPGICRVDVRPYADTLAVKLVNLSTAELEQLPARAVRSIALGSTDWDGPVLQLTGHHYAFRVLAEDRTVEVSVIVGICRDVRAGSLRLSAQAVLRDAQRAADA